MPTMARWLDKASVAAIIAAALCGMLLGGGVSATARSVFCLLAAAAFFCSTASMLVEGRWRMFASPLLALPMALALLAIAQLAPLPGLANLRATSPWVSNKSTDVLMVSANRHATLQACLLFVGSGLLAFAAAHQLRTAKRVRLVGVVMLVALVLSCVVGVTQQSIKNRNPFGLFPLANANPALRDVFSKETAIGLASYRAWQELPASVHLKAGLDNASDFYAPATNAVEPFAGFLERRQWAVCAVALIPLLLTFAAQLLTQATAYGVGDWLWTWESKRAMQWLLAAFGLIGLATWFGDPLATPLCILVAGAVSFFALTGPGRKKALRLAALAFMVAAVVGGIRLSTGGGLNVLRDRVDRAAADNRSLLVAFADHRWFGCGLGAVGELWTIYRPTSAESAVQASSLLAAAVEVGWLGIAIAGLTAVYLTAKWFWVRSRFDPQARLMVGGIVSALVAMTAFAAVGPGMEAPVALALVAVLLGCLARGLGGGYCTAHGGIE